MKISELNPGDSYRVTIGQRSRVYHVRAHVDGLTVVRWWHVYKQRWSYDLVDQQEIDLTVEVAASVEVIE